jgi:hypothetical protein
MIGPGAPQRALDRIDPPLEVVDQLNAGRDVPTPRPGDVQLAQQSAAGETEQVGHGDLMAGRDQRRVHDRRSCFGWSPAGSRSWRAGAGS